MAVVAVGLVSTGLPTERAANAQPGTEVTVFDGIEMGFTGKEPLQVTGTLNVQPKGGYQGSTGRERRAKYLNDRFTLNQVNSWWEAANTHTRFDGTNDYTGNVGHALWEYPQSDPAPHQTAAAAWMDIFCGRPFGRC